MMHDDDEMIMHDRHGCHHVNCTEYIVDDPEIVLDERTSASVANFQITILCKKFSIPCTIHRPFLQCSVGQE